MESGLSEEEFHRMQLQLIELRTENYQLSDKSKKQENEISTLKQQYESLDKESQRLNKSVQKSKKAKEFDAILQENESLQRKLISQEEEFRLQNSTLMQELSHLVAKNEELETVNSKLTSKHNESGAEPSTNVKLEKPTLSREEQTKHDEELVKLRAENAALQKNIGEIKGKFEKELKLLRSVVDSVDITESDSSSSHPLSGEKSLNTLLQESELMAQFNELKLSSDVTLEENRLLKQKINELEKQASGEAMEQLKEKLRKKQESYVKLQEEKESLYEETTMKIKSLEDARQRDIKNFHSQMEKLQEELKKAKEDSGQAASDWEQKAEQYEANIKLLKVKVDEASTKNVDQLKQDNDRLRQEVQTSNDQLQKLRSNLDGTNQSLEETIAQLNKEKTTAHQLMEKLENTEKLLQEKSQTAEKRKKLLDDLAIKSQEDSESYKSKLAQMEASRKEEIAGLLSNHKAEVTELTQALKAEQVKASQIEQLRADLESLNEQNQTLEETKGWLQRSLADLENKHTKIVEQFQEEKIKILQENEDEIKQLKAEHDTTVQNLHDQIAHNEEFLKSSQTQVDQLQQKVKDNVQEMKLHEKKGASLMKDLKRQLAQERKRADRSELKLQELMAEVKPSSGDSFFLPIDADRSSIRADDASSVSSWSGANTSITNHSVIREPSQSSIRESTPRTSPAGSSEYDIPSLLVLVESLQKEKALLSERVSILEQSSTAMADDLLKKQAIIEHYTMEGKEYVHSNTKKSEKMTLKRVMDFVKDKGDESLMEKYRKCQRMLEETLTKNMCLQNDLEVLSKQLAETQAKS